MCGFLILTANQLNRFGPVGEHTEYQTYFKMAKMMVPPPAVVNKMIKDGVNPLIAEKLLDMDKSKPVPYSILQKIAKGAATQKSVGAASTIVKKRLFMDEIPRDRLKGTIWERASKTDPSRADGMFTG